MKKFFKHFGLSQYLLLAQVLLTVATIALKGTTDGTDIVEYVSMGWSLVNGVVTLVVIMLENRQNLKYYEVTSQFIFHKLSNNFDEFMDFLMSDEYKKTTETEQKLFHDGMLETVVRGDYETRRKISRALPYLYDIDRGLTLRIAQRLREDIMGGKTDIRRRTVEAVLTIIQKAEEPNDARRRARRFLDFLHYHEDDDVYTVVALVESIFYISRFLGEKEPWREEAHRLLESLKANVEQVRETDETQLSSAEIDEIFATLSSLADISSGTVASVKAAKQAIERTLREGSRYAKLAVVKNMYYTCKGYPECLRTRSCSASCGTYMMEKVHSFLTSAIDSDVFLAMPTVRYFDCVCYNLHKHDVGRIAKKIMYEYFTSDNLLIMQTAFDKIAMLISDDRGFASHVVSELLSRLEETARAESLSIVEAVSALPADAQVYYRVTEGRKRVKRQGTASYHDVKLREEREELAAIDRQIDQHAKTLSFIGKIKRLKEDSNL